MVRLSEVEALEPENLTRVPEKLELKLKDLISTLTQEGSPPPPPPPQADSRQIKKNTKKIFR
ncbi:hypothetical protein TDIS_2007 [Thermosulfurimonas dismutans]|uniref:Uncharacterized protein n=1 Tax=Thermosulfurimonas dismutans TaxID=999894 RepID=A0A179D1E6_9BACT|nr:hypothetical protein TDIS_2007 [Thermosulfurimonas dismutans]